MQQDKAPRKVGRKRNQSCFVGSDRAGGGCDGNGTGAGWNEQQSVPGLVGSLMGGTSPVLMALAKCCAARWEPGGLNHLFTALGAEGKEAIQAVEKDRADFDTSTCCLLCGQWVLHHP